MINESVGYLFDVREDSEPIFVFSWYHSTTPRELCWMSVYVFNFVRSLISRRKRKWTRSNKRLEKTANHSIKAISTASFLLEECENGDALYHCRWSIGSRKGIVSRHWSKGNEMIIKGCFQSINSHLNLVRMTQQSRTCHWIISSCPCHRRQPSLNQNSSGTLTSSVSPLLKRKGR
jgi:hypothetical protein